MIKKEKQFSNIPKEISLIAVCYGITQNNRTMKVVKQHRSNYKILRISINKKKGILEL